MPDVDGVTKLVGVTDAVRDAVAVFEGVCVGDAPGDSDGVGVALSVEVGVCVAVGVSVEVGDTSVPEMAKFPNLNVPPAFVAPDTATAAQNEAKPSPGTDTGPALMLVPAVLFGIVVTHVAPSVAY